MPLIALFVIAFASLIIVRVGATALMMTGLSRPVADFQAISCFFGVGFTTAESEMIVNHPVRRRIATHLIISGNLGITTALGALIISFVQADPDWLDHLIDPSTPGAFFVRLLVMLGGVLAIAALLRPRPVRRLLERVIMASLRRSGAVRAMDYETVLHSRDGYSVAQVELESDHPLVGATLAGAALGSRGVLVLGIQRRSGEHVGAPDAQTRLEPHDLLTVYGHEGKIHAALDRPRGPATPVDPLSGNPPAPPR